MMDLDIPYSILEAIRNGRTIVVLPMTGWNNYYFSVPSIIFIVDLTFLRFYRQVQKCLTEKCQQFFFIYSNVINTSVIKSV
jgi:hypothetical protein